VDVVTEQHEVEMISGKLSRKNEVSLTFVKDYFVVISVLFFYLPV